MTRGSVHLIMLTLVGVVSITMLRLTLLLGSWHDRVRIQIRLDRCLAIQAMSLRRLINRTEKNNVRMRALRLAIVASTLKPALQTVLRKTLAGIDRMQVLTKYQWRTRRLKWWAIRCGDAMEWATPLPRWPWLRPVPDPIGPRPLVWQSSRRRFHFAVYHLRGLRSGARLWQDKIWRVRWETPLAQWPTLR